MGPIGHTAISTGIGVGVWGATGSPAAGATAIGVGVLTDVDHLFDFYQWYIRRKPNKIYLFFHAWEYSIIGLLLIGVFHYHPILFAAALAHLGHIATDHFHNGMSPWGYSITFRFVARFETDKVAPHHNVLNSYRSWPGLLPFGKRLEPWYRRKVEPWFRSRVGG